MICTLLIIIAIAVCALDEHDTKKKYKQNQPEAQKRIDRLNANMKQWEDLRNKKY
jgi:hypothetical protein